MSKVDKLFTFLEKNEKTVYLFFMLLSLLQFWSSKYVPSLDGPQHLYNANVLVQLINGSSFFDQFFSVNEVLVGYWSGHFFLTFFKFFLPAWLAEKMFLSLYLISFVLSFRYLVRSVNQSRTNFVSYLAFLFAFHSYFLLGYYSFSIAAIFVFLSFGYWIRNQENFTWKNTIVLALLWFAIFLSHGLVFAIFGLSFGVYLLFFFGRRLSQNKDNRKEVFGNILKLVVALIPALFFWYRYISHVMSINSTVVAPSYSLLDLFEFLARIRQLVGFNHGTEAIGYVPVFLLMVFLIVLVLVKKTWIDDQNKYITRGMLFSSLIILAMYFLAPDRLSAGNLTNRFGLFFYLLFVIWLSMKTWSKSVQIIALIIILYASLFTRLFHVTVIKDLSKDAESIEELAPFIPDGSTVDYLQNSSNWLHLHFQLYTACDKEIVHLMNPQCQGQFPVVWDFENMPKVIGERQAQPFGVDISMITNPEVRTLDYVTVFHYPSFLNDSIKSKEMYKSLEGFDLDHLSSNGKVALFKRR